MDPITAAIIAALAKLSESAIADGYNALKTLIVKKFGQGSDVAKAVDAVEHKPESKGRQETLKEEVAAAKADQDPELVSLAQALAQKVASLPGGHTSVNQTVTGNSNIFSGTGNVTVSHKPDTKP
ncbi:MAG: hypothetical protein WCF84_09690 [Anaerolineae bacterium]